MEKNSIKFSDNGSEFNFIFVDGAKSISYKSKSAGFEAVTNFVMERKITVEEYREFQKQILQAKDLPWAYPTRKVVISVFRGDIFDFLESLIASDEPVEIATFTKCPCGENHGRIYCKGGHTVVVPSKNEAFSALDVLRKENHISDEEFEKVKNEIETEML